MKLNIPTFPAAPSPIPALSLFTEPWLSLANDLVRRNLAGTSWRDLMSCLTTLCDHGVGSTMYSRKPPQYTWSMAIKAAELALSISPLGASVVNVGMSRYFEQLDHVIHNKIGKTNDLLTADALEPQRMLRGIAQGKEQIERLAAPIAYLCDIGSGNDLSAESLLYRFFNPPGVELAAPIKQSIEFKTLVSKIDISGNHAFDYLLRFGGYDTAYCYGAITAAVEQGKLVFVDGWSSFAALALVQHMFPAIIDHVWVASHLHSPVFEYIVNKFPFRVLFKNPAPYEGGFYAPLVLKAIEDISKHLPHTV